MGVFFFYNNRKPRKFNYKPILYDPEEDARKEKIEKRVSSIKREMGKLPPLEESERKEFKSEFVSRTKHLKKRKERVESGKKTYIANNTVLIIVAAILIAVFFFWLFS